MDASNHPSFALTFPRYAKKSWYVRVGKKLRYQFFLLSHWYLFRDWQQFLSTYSYYRHFFSDPILYGKFGQALYAGYIDRHFNARQRLDRMCVDLQFAAHYLPTHFLEPTYTQLELADLGNDLTLLLQKNLLNWQEGIWSLGLFYQQQRIYLLTFSVSQSDTLMIGSIQGANQANSKDLIRQVTKLMHGLRPQQLMIWLAWQVADIVGLKTVQGVSTQNHPKMKLSRRLRNKKIHAANYDEIWLSYGATLLPNGNWQIPPLTQKPLEQIESKKRSMYKKRYEMMEYIQQRLQEIMQENRPAIPNTTNLD